MKINTYTEWQWDGEKYVEIANECYDHKGEIAQCGKGGGGGSQQQTTTTEPWSGLKPHLSKSYGEIGGLKQQQFFPQQTHVDRNNLEISADAQRLAHAQQTMPNQIAQAQDGWLGLMGSLDVGNNPHVQGMMDANARSMNKNLTQNLLPAIRANSAGHGQYGSSRQGIAEGLAMQGMQDSLANANAATQMDAYGKGLESVSSALEFSPQMLNLGLQPANITEFVGQGLREDASMDLADQMARWQHTQSEPERLAAARAQMLNGGMTFGTSTTEGANPYKRNGFQDALGTASALAGIISAF